MSMNEFLNWVEERSPKETEFLQVIRETAESIWPFYESKKELYNNRVFQCMVEPERQLVFRVSWMDDQGEMQVNRAFRIQYNSALGPYKGGMRFHPEVNQSIMKFLGFEQTLKNSLTLLPMGGGQGGSDFDPKGKSENEIRRFCNNLMMELYRHIGPNIDVPARDMGVSEREIGYLFGAYGKIKNDYTGVLTGRSLGLGGSPLRVEAAGYGNVYFTEEMLATIGESVEDKTVTVSGYGNVAQYVIEKINELGGKVVTVSDASGFVHDPEGIRDEKLEYLKERKADRNGKVSDYADKFGVRFYPDQKPWSIPCDVAIPCANINDIREKDAKALLDNSCLCLVEGANRATEPKAAALIKESNMLFAPGKAANAGGVAVSGIEMSQTSQRLNWEIAEVDDRLKKIMKNIHKQCVEYGENGYKVDYVKGANIAAFLRVAEAMLSRGLD